MWVFGYGSLMWDDWATKQGCIRAVKATLPGYRRVFNKASVRNWGTKQHRGPTLNIADDPAGSCVGVAFEFPEEKRLAVVNALKDREGKNFELVHREVVLGDDTHVQAVTARYAGPNLIDDIPLAQRAEMARLAVGTDGRCADYVTGIADKLAELSIDDPAVQEFAQAVRRGKS